MTSSLVIAILVATFVIQSDLMSNYSMSQQGMNSLSNQNSLSFEEKKRKFFPLRPTQVSNWLIETS